jgi:hypothetical protein
MHTAPLQDHASVPPPGLCGGTGVENGPVMENSVSTVFVQVRSSRTINVFDRRVVEL